MNASGFLLYEQVLPKKFLQELLTYFSGGTWKLLLLSSLAIKCQCYEGKAFPRYNSSP